jgi:hypothetical protein
VVALIINVIGVHIMSSTKDAPPELRAGLHSVLGWPRGVVPVTKPSEYAHLCACEDVEAEGGGGSSRKRPTADAGGAGD